MQFSLGSRRNGPGRRGAARDDHEHLASGREEHGGPPCTAQRPAEQREDDRRQDLRRPLDPGELEEHQVRSDRADWNTGEYEGFIFRLKKIDLYIYVLNVWP